MMTCCHDIMAWIAVLPTCGCHNETALVKAGGGVIHESMMVLVWTTQHMQSKGWGHRLLPLPNCCQQKFCWPPNIHVHPLLQGSGVMAKPQAVMI